MKTFKYRLYPTSKQAQILEWTLDRCRELYNAALQERKDAWRMCHVSINFSGQSAQLPEIKQIREEYKDVYAQVLQDVLHRIDKAYKAFFRRVKNGEKPGHPRFVGKNRYDSFTYPQAEHGFSLTHDNRLCLAKIGTIKVKYHREVEGTIKTCTIKREGQHWYVCFSCDVEEMPHLPYTDESIGIDLGLLHFATLSSGDTIDNPRYYRKTEKKLEKAQQSLSRKKKKDEKTGCKGNRRKKAVRRVAKCHRKVRNQRNDFLHKQSRQLVNTYELIVFEDLASSNLSKRPNPKQDETGKYLPNGASAKAGLNKSINDAGWSTFIAFCEYKAASAGTVQVVKVNPYKTSQICSNCGQEGRHKDLSKRWHSCECGCELDRDHNAALNILTLGRRVQKTRF